MCGDSHLNHLNELDFVEREREFQNRRKDRDLSDLEEQPQPSTSQESTEKQNLICQKYSE